LDVNQNADWNYRERDGEICDCPQCFDRHPQHAASLLPMMQNAGGWEWFRKASAGRTAGAALVIAPIMRSKA
jgi:hypothetical protein